MEGRSGKGRSVVGGSEEGRSVVGGVKRGEVWWGGVKRGEVWWGEGRGEKCGVVETVGRMWRVERGSGEKCGESVAWYVGWSHVLMGAVMQYCYPHTALYNFLLSRVPGLSHTQTNKPLLESVSKLVPPIPGNHVCSH